MLNVRTFLEKFGIEYVEHPAENVARGWIGINPCPSCGRGWQSFGVNATTGASSCWVCGYKSNVYNLVKELTNEKSSVIYKEYKNSKNSFSTPFYEQKTASIVKMPSMLLNTLPDNHRNYLINRNFDPDFLSIRYNLMATEMIPVDWQYRIIIPIYYQYRMVSYVGRTIFDSIRPKYRNAKTEDSILSLKDCLPGLDEVGKHAVLFEGITDKWRFGSGAIATMGVDVTNKQINMLKKSGVEKVTVAFDPDKAGIYAAKKLSEKIALLGLETSLVLWDDKVKKDVGDFSGEEIFLFRREVFNS